MTILSYPAVLKRRYLELGIRYWHTVKNADFVINVFPTNQKSKMTRDPPTPLIMKTVNGWVLDAKTGLKWPILAEIPIKWPFLLQVVFETKQMQFSEIYYSVNVPQTKITLE